MKIDPAYRFSLPFNPYRRASLQLIRKRHFKAVLISGVV